MQHTGRRHAVPLSDRLRAELRIEPPAAQRPEDFAAIGRLTNAANEPLTLQLAPLSSPSLAIQLRDAQGTPVPMPPPPVPGAEQPRLELAPGQRHDVRYQGFLPSWTEPGSYAARLRYVTAEGEVFSDWSAFELRRPS